MSSILESNLHSFSFQINVLSDKVPFSEVWIISPIWFKEINLWEEEMTFFTDKKYNLRYQTQLFQMNKAIRVCLIGRRIESNK